MPHSIFQKHRKSNRVDLMRRFFLSAIVAVPFLLGACDGGESESPDVTIVGLFQSSIIMDGISEKFSSLSDCEYEYTFLLGDDSSFSLYRFGDGPYHEIMAGVFRQSNDSIFVSLNNGEDALFFTGFSQNGNRWIAWNLEKDGESTGEKRFVCCDEIRYTRDFCNAYNSIGQVYALGARIPKSRELFYPDVLETGKFIGYRYATTETGDTVRNRCLWNITSDSSIVEYIIGEKNAKRKLSCKVKWDPADINDSIFITREGVSLGMKLEETSTTAVLAYSHDPYVYFWLNYSQKNDDEIAEIMSYNYGD